MTTLVKAQQSASTFRMRCAVAIEIRAPIEKIWRLLTHAKAFVRWNSTVSRIDGEIAIGERLALQVPIAPGRTFKPKVVEFEPNSRMVWADGTAPMFTGRRTFRLTPAAGGVTRFEMEEVFSGLMLPMIKRSLPDFGPVFETFAADLKRHAELPSE